jgi:hypothetical protein
LTPVTRFPLLSKFGTADVEGTLDVDEREVDPGPGMSTQLFQIAGSIASRVTKSNSSARINCNQIDLRIWMVRSFLEPPPEVRDAVLR